MLLRKAGVAALEPVVILLALGIAVWLIARRRRAWRPVAPAQAQEGPGKSAPAVTQQWRR